MLIFKHADTLDTLGQEEIKPSANSQLLPFSTRVFLNMENLGLAVAWKYTSFVEPPCANRGSVSTRFPATNLCSCWHYPSFSRLCEGMCIKEKWHFLSPVSCADLELLLVSDTLSNRGRGTLGKPGRHPRFFPLPSYISSFAKSWTLPLPFPTHPLLFIFLPRWEWSSILMGTGRVGSKVIGLEWTCQVKIVTVTLGRETYGEETP